MANRQDITHNREDFEVARMHLTRAMHRFYDHADESAANKALEDMNNITGVHFQHEQMCAFRVLHNLGVIEYEDMGRHRPLENRSECNETANECDFGQYDPVIDERLGPGILMQTFGEDATDDQ